MCTNCGCNSCNECNECSGQYSSNCKPILDVNCLPTLGRTSRHYLYRTPDSKLWYANANCTAWLELTRDEAKETNQLNVLLDLTNRVIEVEQALKAKKDEKPSDKEDKPTDKDKTLSEALEALKKELEGKASVTGLEEVNKAVQKLSDALNAKEDKDTIYDDSEIKKALEEVKATVAKLETKEDKDTIFDPSGLEAKVTSVETRLTTLESKEDNDKQTLSIDGKEVSISGGNTITLPEESDPLFKKIMTGAFQGYTEGLTDFDVWANSTLQSLNSMITGALEEIDTIKQNNKFRVASIEKEWTLEDFIGKVTIPFKDGVSFPYSDPDFVSWSFYVCGLDEEFSDSNIYASNRLFNNASVTSLSVLSGSEPILQDGGLYLEFSNLESGLQSMSNDYIASTTDEEKRATNKKLKLVMKLVKIVED